MRKLLLPLLCLLALGTKAETRPIDTLILTDGKIVTGTIDDESITVLFNVQANINTWHTFIIHADKTKEKIQNKDIAYVITGDVKYTNKRVIGGNKLVQMLADGPYAQMYVIAGNIYHHFSSLGPAGVDGIRNWKTTVQPGQWRQWTEITVKDKPLPYAVGSTPLSRVFKKLFDKCPSLMQESEQPGFNFEDYEGIVKKYNACF
ncbi:MAG: hypothetical protein JSS76_02860 [Bacteroidetes bacterium]|nr:hypothetical protein [Bacteroidota bacterium]